MGQISDYIDFNAPADTLIQSLKEKSVNVPLWAYLKKQYNPNEHEILTDTINLRDKHKKDGTVEKSSRLSIGMERLLVRRMSEFMFSIPIKRIYHNTEDDEEKRKIAKSMESIFKYSRMSSNNLQRSKDFYACCEIFTLWYAVKSSNTLYGFPSEFKIKCKTFSPKEGSKLYPLFDEYGDMVAFSFQYEVTIENKSILYFETYTDSRHYKWRQGTSGWEAANDPEDIIIEKIPGVYLWRDEAIYAEVANIRKEIEYTLSRNSNVIAYNSAPILKVVGELAGEEKRGEDYRLFRMESGGDVSYVTWPQSIQAITTQIGELKELFWNLTQMPDISFSNMQRLGNIGYDARETLLTDAHLKVGDESGPWIEFFERETNVIKAFLKKLNTSWADKIDDIEVEHIITPFIQRNESAEIQKRMTANGGKPIESQRESIQRFGRSQDPDETLRQIRDEEMESNQASVTDIFESMN